MSLMFALDDQNSAELPAGTKLLGGLYQIEEGLQQGGFAMTYIARDSLDRHVVIKECFPSEICERREGMVYARTAAVESQFNAVKAQFLREARGVASLKHPDVVAVHQVFEENNTAYMALDYVAGMDLISVLEDEPERLSGAFIEKTLIGTLKALRHIHSNGILHRDIAPDNIRVDGSDRITLIDFGAAGARGSRSGAADGSVPAVKDGYSPPEFYVIGDTQDFSSDLYALGATFHHLLTGDVPPDGPSRRAAVAAGQDDPYQPLAAGSWNCGYHVLVTIDLALSLPRETRPQSADLWLDALEVLPKVKPVLPAEPVFDPMLDVAVCELVRDVNAFLSTVEPKPRRMTRSQAAVVAAAAAALSAASMAGAGAGAAATEAVAKPSAAMAVRLINPNYDELSRAPIIALGDLSDRELLADASGAAAASKRPTSFFSRLFSRYLSKNHEAVPS